MWSKRIIKQWGSGCVSVSRLVASDSASLRFESSHWQKIIFNIYCQLTVFTLVNYDRRVVVSSKLLIFTTLARLVNYDCRGFIGLATIQH